MSENKPITEQLAALIETGTEAEVRQFILDHMQEFPPEAQQAFAVGFFEEALDEREAAMDQLLQDRADVANAIDAMEKAQDSA